MFDRFTHYVHFWSALTVGSAIGGVFAVSAEVAAQSAGMAAKVSPFNVLFSTFPSFIQIAPYLSFTAFMVAVFGWRRLHREVSRQFPQAAASSTDRALLWHDAIQANTDGIFLLRAVRDNAGTLVDFEISDSNGSAARFVGGSQSLLIGRRVRRDYPAPIGTYLMDVYARALESGEPFTEDVRVNRRIFSAGWLFHQAVPTNDGIAVTIRDISSRKREEKRLRRATVTDELTLLYNRRGFMALGEQQLRVARRQGTDTVLLYIDVDDFKPLNDLYGHAEGDKALMAVGRLLRRTVRDSDVVARLGGDEFTVLALDADRTGARLIQKRIEERVAMLNASGLLAAPISLTVGHTRVRPTDSAPLAELLARADSLLYARKKRRKHVALLRPAKSAAPAESKTRLGQPNRAVSTTFRLATPSSAVAHPPTVPAT